MIAVLGIARSPEGERSEEGYEGAANDGFTGPRSFGTCSPSPVRFGSRCSLAEEGAGCGAANSRVTYEGIKAPDEAIGPTMPSQRSKCRGYVKGRWPSSRSKSIPCALGMISVPRLPN